MGRADWDADIDVLVVGSGAGGLTAALASSQARTVVIEKSSEFGGTSATSGGGIWIPNSDQAQAAGLRDSDQEAFAYVRSQSAPNVPDGPIRAYVRYARVMLRWLEANSPVRYASLPYPDYHVEFPGGKPGYRTHLPIPMDGRALGADLLKLRGASPAASLFGMINWRLDEMQALLFRPKGWTGTLARMLWRYASDFPHRLRSSKDRNLTNGVALIGGLYLALKQRGVPMRLGTALVELVVEDGQVLGAIVNAQGTLERIRVRRGVILAAGGFERNPEMRRKHLPGSDDPAVSGSQINNTGDGILAAERAGAALRNMHSSWTAPVFRVPGEARGRLSAFERALPGCIMVSGAGRRYLNEAADYHVVGRQMVALNQPGAETRMSWVIFDARFRHKYPMGPLLPLIPDALQPKGVRDILRKASTIEKLGKAIGVPAANLQATITRFNEDAQKGVDTEFSRGAAAYDRMYGDPSVQPNPSLAPIAQAPFYAMPIFAGDIGTNGGVVTDELGRALDSKGRIVGGLYAVGNNAASVMGESYPGAGVTLGPAMTFGYLAARHALGLQPCDPSRLDGRGPDHDQLISRDALNTA